jgi:hypothetical protein
MAKNDALHVNYVQPFALLRQSPLNLKKELMGPDEPLNSRLTHSNASIAASAKKLAQWIPLLKQISLSIT